jgi:hypothetical protein
MPIRYIKAQQGYQYGKTGKVYKISEFGKQGAYFRALQQTKAIKASEARHGTIKVKATSRARGYERRV